MRNEELLRKLKEERNILHTVNRRKANWIGHVLLKNFLTKRFVVEKIERTGKGGRRSKQLLDNFEGQMR